jgi:hypothetical protein
MIDPSRTAQRDHATLSRFAVPIAFLVLLATAVPTLAQDAGFTCRARVVRVAGEGPLAEVFIEPFVANGSENPCVAESTGLIDEDLPAGLGHAAIVFASTDVSEGGAASEAGVVDLRLLGPAGSPLEGHFLEVSVLTSNAAVACSDGAPEFSGSSQVVGLSIDGQEIVVPEGNAHTDISLGPLGTLHLNEQTETADQITQQAVFLDTPLVDVVVAEAVADVHGAACGAAGPGNGNGDGGPPACSDELDNDGDGFIDYPNDPGCASPQDDDETDNEAPECSDGTDNDMDGDVDYPADPGCDSRSDDDESDGDGPECSDEVDNDGDGQIDSTDDGCKSPEDDDEAAGFITGLGGYDEEDNKTLDEDFVNPGTFLRGGGVSPCDVGDSPGPNLTVGWHEPGNQGRFKLESLSRAFCRNDPDVDPGGPPAEFDTFVGEGSGTFTNALGATSPARAVFIWIDRGEPGAPPVIGVDFFSITVTDPTGMVVLAQAVGTLDEGNIQAHTPAE